jgi:hypothetical protein
MANPEHIQTCLEEAKTLLVRVIERLPAGPAECHLKNCLGCIDKVEALMKGDYETVWRIEADLRKRDNELHTYAMRNLVTKQQTLKELCEPSPVVAALLAMRSTPAQQADSDEDLYS